MRVAEQLRFDLSELDDEQQEILGGGTKPVVRNQEKVGETNDKNWGSKRMGKWQNCTSMFCREVCPLGNL